MYLVRDQPNLPVVETHVFNPPLVRDQSNLPVVETHVFPTFVEEAKLGEDDLGIINDEGEGN